jgi:ribose transport system substrate-binding protein
MTQHSGLARIGWLAVLVAALVAAVVVAGCGSSDSDSESTQSGTTAAGSGGGSQGLEAAEQVVAKYSERPTQIPISTPIGKPVPAGKTVVYLNCGLPTCAFQYGIIKEAAEVLGWSAKSVANDGTPEGVDKAWEQVLAMKPDGVIYSGTPRAQIEKQLLQAEDEGITVAAYSVPDKVGDGIDFIAATFEDQKPASTMLAAWPVADSGEEPEIVLVNLALPILTYIKEEFHTEIPKFCECKVDDLEIPLTATDSAQRIASYLRGHSSVKYLALTDNSLASGLPAALRSAGLSDVKVIGVAATPETLQQLAGEEISRIVSFPYYEILYSDVDAIARAEAGVPLLKAIEHPLPYWYITAENQESTEQVFPLVKNYKEQFEKLWGK